jgi:molybdate transport system ATP-binding protein
VLSFDCQFRYKSGFSLDFAFNVAEQVAILIGPSGSGKTTVLNLIAGLLTADEGEIVLGNKILFSSRQSIDMPVHQRQVGYFFQDYQLFPHLSVEQNLLYGYRRAIKRTVEVRRVVDVLELAQLIQRYPASLSGGQQQRVAIGRALLSSPEVLLLDEPLNALDTRLRESIADYLKKIIEEFSIPTLIVSHEHSHLSALQEAQPSIITMPAMG